jgi:hypothetical protein
MVTLVLSPRDTDDSEAVASEAVAAAAVRAGWDVERLERWRAPERLRGRDVALYGEALFVEVIAARLGLALIEAPALWLTTLPERYLRRRVTASTLAAARRATGRAFVKPADGKSFPAAVYDGGRTLPDPDTGHLAPDTLVLVSEPVLWDVEYRCFVHERRVAAISPYLRHRELAQAPDGTWPVDPAEVAQALAFATALLADDGVAVPPAAVIDVGHTRDAGWAVVESNAAWASGICGAAPEDVLPVLRRAVRKPGEVGLDDRPWLRAPVEFE